MGSWSDLMPELVVEVAVKVKQIEDFKAFRGVCTSWRAAAAKDIFKGGSKIPLLMLSENKRDSSSDEREFYSLSRKKIYKAAVPEAKGKRCTDARFGWVVAAAPSGGELYLFKPFSSSPTIPLPNFHTFLRSMSYRFDPEAKFVEKAILTANPSHTSDFMVFALMDSDLAFWKNGDKNWTMIRCNIPTGGFINIGFCGHKMYGIDSWKCLYSWDPSAPDLTRLILVTTLDDFLGIGELITPYIVESSGGELLIITRNNVCFGGYKTTGATRFKVARIDAVTGHWEVISGGIGRDAVFIGENASVSVAADDYPGAVKPNSIYFTDDRVRGDKDSEGGKDMGIYDIEQGTIERFPIQSFSPLSPPFWVFP